MSNNVWVRVTAEHEVLWENIEKLQAFRDGKQPSNVSDYQWKLLKKQLKAMRKYNKILALRVEDLYENEILAVQTINEEQVTDPLDVEWINPGDEQSNQDFFKTLKGGHVRINHETGEWTNANPVLTPGQSDNIDVNDFKLQSNENFMKDESEKLPGIRSKLKPYKQN